VHRMKFKLITPCIINLNLLPYAPSKITVEIKMQNKIELIDKNKLLSTLIQGKSEEFIQLMENNSIDVNSYYEDQGKNKTLLSILLEKDTVKNSACAEDYKKIALYLLEKGADLDLNPYDPNTGYKDYSPAEILSQRKNNNLGPFWSIFPSNFLGQNILSVIKEFKENSELNYGM
jgi:ankyrin repeat protein